MRKLLFLALSIFTLPVTAARAQDLPKADLSVGYSYFREGFSDGVNANGGTVAVTSYTNRWLGITGDFEVLVGGAHLTAGASGVSASANGFARSAGVDLVPSRHLAFRPQFDYIGIHVGADTVITARVSASVIFRFSSR